MRLFTRVFSVLIGLSASSLFAEITVTNDSPLQTVFTVTSRQMTMTPVMRQGRWYSEIRLPNFEHRSAIGAPEIPFQIVRLLVPEGAAYQIEVLSKNAPRRIGLKHELAFARTIPIHEETERLAKRDRKAYQRTYGSKLVEVNEEGFVGNDRILSLRLSPVRYQARTRRLSLTPHFRVRVRYTGGKSRVKIEASSIARHLVLNRETLRARQSGPKIDLILAHTSYENSLFHLIEFKVSRGRQVRVHYVEGKTAEEIKAIIKKEYESTEPPSETLLVGNPSQIPAFPGSADNTLTDYNYQLLGTDSIPDIALGRIPASNALELRNFVDKILARELEPRDVAQILITAGRDTSMGCPANVTKVGNHLKQAGDDIHITRKFRTEVSTGEVIAGYNQNPNLIVYDGHGNR